MAVADFYHNVVVYFFAHSLNTLLSLLWFAAVDGFMVESQGNKQKSYYSHQVMDFLLCEKAQVFQETTPYVFHLIIK